MSDYSSLFDLFELGISTIWQSIYNFNKNQSFSNNSHKMNNKISNIKCIHFRYTDEALVGQPLLKSYIIIRTIIVINNKNWLIALK